MTDRAPSSLLDEATTLIELFLARVKASSAGTAYRFFAGGGWRPVTWHDFHRRVRETALGLVQLGLQPGEVVAIIAGTRPEWGICELAGLMAGGITVGLHPAGTPAQLADSLHRTQSSIVIVQDTELLERLRLVRDQLDPIKHIIVWSGGEDLDGEREVSLFHLNRIGREAPRTLRAELDARYAALEPEDTANYIFTPGTTDPAKVVVLSHRNILAALKSFDRLDLFQPDDYTVSFLPMSDVAEKVIGFYNRTATGISTTFTRGPHTLLEDIAEIRPTVFGATPKFFEAVYDTLMRRVAQSGTPKRFGYRWALRVGLEAAHYRMQEKRLPPLLKSRHALAEAVLFRPLREVLGSNMRHAIVGAAPIQREVLEFFFAIGLPLYEVYGLIESSAIATANRPGAVRIGSVGRPVEGVDVALSDEKEILLRGENVFASYLGDEASTRAAFDPNGWLYSGDIGRVDGEGFLTLTDRKVNLITLSGGRTIAPRNTEHLLAREPAIEHALLAGEQRPHLTALIVLNPREAPNLADKLGLSYHSLQTFCRESDVVQYIQTVVNRTNEELSPAERIGGFRILPRALRPELGELTPNRKTRRAAILANCADLIEAMYA